MAICYFEAWRLFAASHLAVLRHIICNFFIRVVGHMLAYCDSNAGSLGCPESWYTSEISHYRVVA